ncbi:MAG: SpoIIE family protein phosphatase [Desulfobacterales bacterium]
MDKKHILIAEDEYHNRTALSLILKMSGYEVTEAANGMIALRNLEEMQEQEKLPDLLITDIQMPEITGMELIDELRARNIRIPVLVMTGYGDKETVIELMRKGCSEYIDKPFGPEEMSARVKNVLEMQEKARAERKKEMEEEKSELSREAQSCRMHFETLRSQVDLAVESYKTLIQTGDIQDRVRAVYRHKPFRELGGDFLDMCPTAEGCDILIADVAGHDMGASYHTILLKAFFEENCRTGNDGKTFFRILNRQLTDEGKNERMVTALFLRLNLEKMQGEIISAGHPPLLRLSALSGETEFLLLEGDVLGMKEDSEFAAKSFSLNSGDRFFLYTDGLINAYTVDGESGNRHRFTETGLALLAKKFSDLPIEEMINRIEENFTGISGYKRNDDMLILGLEIP